jgi:hypothetical protein
LVVRRRPRSWTFDVSILFSETSGLIVDPFIYSNIPEAPVDEAYISQMIHRNVVDDEQPTRNVVTCNKNNQYDHMTGMNNCFEELPS